MVCEEQDHLYVAKKKALSLIGNLMNTYAILLLQLCLKNWAWEGFEALGELQYVLIHYIGK